LSFFFKWFSPFLLFLTVCQPLDINFSTVDPSKADNLLNNSNNHYFVPHLRPGQNEFLNKLLSDKLDLVFVLDTGPGMESFYKSNAFHPNFLNRFKKYDWKFAYTDMSVDIQLIQKFSQKQNTKTSLKPSCGFLKSLFAASVGASIQEPITTGIGVAGLLNCLSSPDFRTKFNKKEFANGAFLPFEHYRKKAKLEYPYQLTQSVEDYNSIFDHSLRLNNSRKVWFQLSLYDAPKQRKAESYPVLAMLLSIAQGYFTSPANSQNQQASSFFRKDSSIVYVLFTNQDMKFEIPSETLQQELDSFLGSHKRMKIIPITWTKASNMLCGLKHSLPPNDSPKLRNLAEQLGHKALDICSSNLADQLFDEISQSLYSNTSLSNL